MWKFNVQNIGKVAQAEITMSPLVILVGRNNTGKSYIATLVWALANLYPLLSREDARERRPSWYRKFFSRGDSEKGASLEIDPAKAAEVIEHVEQELRINGSDFLRDVFAYNGFDQTTIQLTAEAPFVPFIAAVSKADFAEPDKRASIVTGRISELNGRPAIQFRFPVRAKETMRRLEDRLFTEIVYRTLSGEASRRLRSVIYVPAARTGLMLAIRALIAQLFEADDSLTPSLPRPLADFLQRLSLRTGREDDASGEIAAWLQSEIMHGSIEVSDEEVPAFTYIPENTEMAVPLHAASSMITELAPFLVLLKESGSAGQIIFEEPEAHLHLSAQRSMARALARILNSGTRVLVTTHSDTFVQQINNLMQLYAHPKRSDLMKKFGYQDADLINPADAEAYEFSPDADRTFVKKLKKSQGGFIVPSLNETLYQLSNETISLQEEEND